MTFLNALTFFYFLNFSISFLNGCSQQHIFTILIPFNISEVIFIRSSVALKVLALKIIQLNSLMYNIFDLFTKK
jgi:hypothetical protein